ncbi:linoleate diol synthase [Piedraia hortae CBS 480.64]|uniref:Linoleate diol synthase n=1 Tax=Piedraia hortae CBS 480.64 TaxID=1314780 RepID=A0A6A7BZY5_9PEZI|nr:linoleate diol synthase [Piedraia hortae CBS 480.64]
MEHLIIASALLQHGTLDDVLTGKLVTQLWNDLEHPPTSSVVRQYRMPDGSGNSERFPQMGKSFMPYARTVASGITQAGALPDPGILFDTCMARETKDGKPHPAKISSMLFYLASIITHDLFKTNGRDAAINETSSYLDLAPLYGSTWEEQKEMRTMKDGKLKPDCFSEAKLLYFPPGVGALLIMFNRYHNWMAEQLALINEGGRFTENEKQPEVERYGEKINKRDDDLFQTARLVTCVLYVNIILKDYVRTILNLNSSGNKWSGTEWNLDPRMEIENGPPRGTGNQVSCEFNLVYRWHAAISSRDAEWTSKEYNNLMKAAGVDVDPSEASEPQNIYQFLGALRKAEDGMKKLDPTERPFPPSQHETLQRISDGPLKGRYDDNQLAEIITNGIEDCANAFGPLQTPPIMKVIEVLGITQARQWGVASLNEFRQHFNLKPHMQFEDITSNTKVQKALRHLYGTPDKVELYPGLMLEDAKPHMEPGSGLCPPFTVSRAVLADAVALVRGDCFYTTSCTPGLLTNFGFKESSYDTNINSGGVFYKLMLRALPQNFHPCSVYAHFPFTVPHRMQTILRDLAKENLYNFDKPRPIPRPQQVTSYKAAVELLENSTSYRVFWTPAIEFLMGDKGRNFMLACDNSASFKSRSFMDKALYLNDGRGTEPCGQERWFAAVRDFYTRVGTELVQQNSCKLAGKAYIDVLRDVGYRAHPRFCAKLFGIQLRDPDQCDPGEFTESSFLAALTSVFTTVFYDIEPAKSFALHQRAKEAARHLGATLELIIDFLAVNDTLPNGSPHDELHQWGHHMLRSLHAQEPNVDTLIWTNLIGTLGGMCTNQVQILGQVLDYLLSPQGLQTDWPAIQKLSQSDDPDSFAQLMRYFTELFRLHGETALFRVVAEDTPTHSKGDVVLVNLPAASRDPEAFPDPESINLNRPWKDYIHLGWGMHKCLGAEMTLVANTALLRVLGRLKGLQPERVVARGVRGPARVDKIPFGDSGFHAYLDESWAETGPFPRNLRCVYEV